MRVLDPRLMERARAVRTVLIADVGIGLLTAALVLAQATLLAEVIARSFDGAALSALRTPLLLLIGCFALRGVLAWGFEVAGRLAATSVLSQLRMGLVRRRLADHPTALDGAHSAELATAAVFGATPLEAYFGRLLPQLVLACVIPVAVILWIIPIDATSAAIMLLTLPLVPVFMILIGTYTRRRTQERQRALDLLATHFLDVVRGLPTLRSFNRGSSQTRSIADAGERYRRATMATLRVAFLSGAVLELAATIGVALVAVTVGVRLDDGGLSLRAALTVLILAPELYLPLRTVGTLYHTSADGLEVAERLLPLSEPLPQPSELPVRVVPPPGPICCEAVGYAYPARDLSVLSHVDLQIDPGELVVLVGESGSGKSTLASVVLGLASPTTGRVTVGGLDLAGCDQAAWRRSLAWVPQRPALLRETVADNIRLGDGQIDDRAVREAALNAGADEFIRALPDGYDTLLGDGGRQVSAGQRQRIALARAFARDARLVVLDEPTANVDAHTAVAIGQAIERLAGDRSVLVIAHSPEVIGRADRVVRLDHGRLVAQAAIGVSP
jgi:ATP-binding cassette subfamily C protein CydD